MDATRTLKKILAGTLLSGGIAAAGLVIATGTAQSQPGLAPQFDGPISGSISGPRSGPFGGPFPADNFTVPHDWCPGQGLPMPDVHWDMNVCHHWYWVPVGGMGNVGQFVWEGDAPRQPLGPPPCYGAPICLPGL